MNIPDTAIKEYGFDCALALAQLHEGLGRPQPLMISTMLDKELIHRQDFTPSDAFNLLAAKIVPQYVGYDGRCMCEVCRGITYVTGKLKVESNTFKACFNCINEFNYLTDRKNKHYRLSPQVMKLFL